MNATAETREQKTCETCEHYRVPAPLSAICRKQVRGADEELVKALDNAARQDYARLEEERLALTHGGAEDGVWRTRPRAMPYCALYEKSEFFYVSHIKNPNGECPDHKPVAHTPADCRTCANLRRATGEAADAEILQRLADAQVGSPHVGAVGQQRERVLTFIASRKAAEVNEAYRNAGWLAEQPRYLDWCGAARSESHKYWVAEALNTQGSCAQYTALGQAMREDPSTNASSASADQAFIPVNGTVPADHLREQGREIVREILTALQGPAREFLKTRSRAAAANTSVLVNGVPPLTAEMVRRAREVIEKLTGCSLSAQQRSVHQAFIESVWSANNRGAIEFHLDIIRNHVALTGQRLTEDQIAPFRAKLRSAASAAGADFARWLDGIDVETRSASGMVFARTSGQ